MSAFASGREGEAYVDAVQWIVVIVLVVLIAIVIGGALLGVSRARQRGDSILMGGLRGLFKGLVAFLIVCALATAGLTVLGMLWIAYSFLSVYVLSP